MSLGYVAFSKPNSNLNFLQWNAHRAMIEASGSEPAMSIQEDRHTPSPTHISALRAGLTFHGLAVVSSDGYISRSSEDLTFSWSSGADKEHFFTSIEHASLCIMGRKTHELYPNIAHRSRLVFSRSAPDNTRDPNDPHSIFCNVDSIPSVELLRRIVGLVKDQGHKRICILGGGEVYRLFLEHPALGFDSFDLTVETRILHEDGVPFIPSLSKAGLNEAIQALRRSGMRVIDNERLTPDTLRISFQSAKILDLREVSFRNGHD